MTKSLIHLQPFDIVLSYSKGYSSLLDFLEAHQIPVEFQCRSGYCGACRLYLLAGKVKYQQDPLAFVGLGEIIPCCCLPVDDIELDLKSL